MAPTSGAACIEEYRDRLPVARRHPGDHAGRGRHAAGPGPRAVRAHRLRRLAQGRGREPDRVVQGPRHDHGDLAAAEATAPRPSICASTGNTSASAAAYAAAAGMACAVLVPEGKIALGKLGQAIVHGAAAAAGRRQLRRLPRRSPASSPRATRSRWSTRSTRSGSRGRRPPPSRSSTRSATRPTSTCLPVGNAGNITAYWKGYREYARATADGHAAAADVGLPGGRRRADRPRRTRSTQPETIATAIRIGNPASWQLAVAARDESGGLIEAVDRRRRS